MFFSLSEGGMVYFISSIYLNKRINVVASYKKVYPQLPDLQVLLVIVGAMLFGGFLLLVIPGIILMIFL